MRDIDQYLIGYTWQNQRYTQSTDGLGGYEVKKRISITKSLRMGQINFQQFATP
jgi:hypothetical protein